MVTAALRQADVYGAGVTVVTLKLAFTQALAVLARVIGGAGVVVIARQKVVGVDAANGSIAAVICADITVITIKW
jgi:hypothetical protein